MFESLEQRTLMTTFAAVDHAAITNSSPLVVNHVPTTDTTVTSANDGHVNACTATSNQSAMHPESSYGFSFSATATSSTQVLLSWHSASGANGYYIDIWQNGAWKQIGNMNAATTAVNVTGLSANTTYYFDVGAYNNSGVTWANYLSVTTQPVPKGTIDHPKAGATYTQVNGSLFGSSGPVFTDIHQGNEGDCWLMASLAEVAARKPSDITKMFTYSGTTVENGTTVSLYKVRFYDNSGVARYVTVDTELPGGGTYYDHVNGGVLWAALAEKAYVEANGMGYVTSGSTYNDSYDALDGGSPSWALHAITGLSSNDFAVNPSNLVAAWNSGKLIVLDSSTNANDNLIVGGSHGTHAYAFVGYNSSSSNPFELYNPWGASSTVNGTVSFYGKSVYGGACYVSSSMITNDFAGQEICGQLIVSAGQSDDIVPTLTSTENERSIRRAS